MRTFIAIEVPEEIEEYLRKVQKQLGNAKLSLVKDFHLTLKFLGDVPENKIEEITSSLKEIKFEKFKTRLTDVGIFPNENYVRVIWVGLEDSQIKDIQKDVDEKLVRIFPGEKNFSSHITLARVKFVENKEKFLNNLKKIKIEKKEFEVNEFKLKKSTLTGNGPIYEDLEIFKPQYL